MNTLASLYHRWDTPLLRNLIFWAVIFLFHLITTNQVFYSNAMHLVGAMSLITLLQIGVAYTTLYGLIPNFLNKKRFFVFGILLILLLFIAAVGYHAANYYYFEPAYPQSYATRFEAFGYQSMFERITDISLTASKAIFFFSPTVLMLLFQFYRDQQRLSEINEQKKTSELTALKHQLNPHFLFNTLNNVYALAVKKSDKTPEVISKLSDILDYVLYRCNEDYVPLGKEVELIENYLTLEKIRYGKRVAVTFNPSYGQEMKIAPLLLLTFVENAFKHGVSQEINQASIDIMLHAHKNTIVFSIKNTIPTDAAQDSEAKPPIGLKNVRKQLELLYPKAHQLRLDEAKDTYMVTLDLKTL
ncbi:sensor histidine kinase [Dyadobacter arcticus]|uniref:Sensor histidine kinase YesM n=1 Tax=Dyadobacter arcticus TaxID=1078754 RepID=A0ABX0UNU4_9BACT|nr:histidine kinase [Dyadobacter arcticus]NIJ54661.1 sensor histidine kinase YesM [Dyadobacter arcticus]